MVTIPAVFQSASVCHQIIAQLVRETEYCSVRPGANFNCLMNLIVLQVVMKCTPAGLVIPQLALLCFGEGGGGGGRRFHAKGK